jgi:hypothetical protein
VENGWDWWENKEALFLNRSVTRINKMKLNVTLQ